MQQLQADRSLQLQLLHQTGQIITGQLMMTMLTENSMKNQTKQVRTKSNPGYTWRTGGGHTKELLSV